MGLTASEGTAKEHDWRGSCHLHQASILDAKARGRQKLSAYTHRHLRLVTHLLAVFSLKALHVKFDSTFESTLQNSSEFQPSYPPHWSECKDLILIE